MTKIEILALLGDPDEQKTCTEYYIPIILVVGFLLFSAIAICLALFANFCKKKFLEKNQNDDWSEEE